jgi:hypothetical protein
MTEEEEERDIIEESVRTAQEEDHIREEETKLEDELRKAKDLRLNLIGNFETKDAAKKRRQDRLGEIMALMMTRKCPALGCQFRFQYYGSDSSMTCKCIPVIQLRCPYSEAYSLRIGTECRLIFCVRCYGPWQTYSAHSSCIPSEASQIRDAKELSQFEQEMYLLEREQKMALHDEHKRAQDKIERKWKTLLREAELNSITREIERQKSESVYLIKIPCNYSIGNSASCCWVCRENFHLNLRIPTN